MGLASFQELFSGAKTIRIDGAFYRHTSLQHTKLEGSKSGGRWAFPDTFLVIYLGRPQKTAIAEAYRHLVDPIEGMRPEFVKPRAFLRCQAIINPVLDLRHHETVKIVNVSSDDLVSNNYKVCQKVGQAAYETDYLKGILAPSATGIGETLALFGDRLDKEDTLQIKDQTIWETLPPDPRI